MIFAGHESTAGTIAATLGFLALYPKEQDIVYAEISEFAEMGSEWGIDVYDKLVKTRSAFAEALRLIPAATMMIRAATRDTVIKVPYLNPDGADSKNGKGGVVEREVLMKKGTTLVGDLLGVREYPDTTYSYLHRFASIYQLLILSLQNTTHVIIQNLSYSNLQDGTTTIPLTLYPMICTRRSLADLERASDGSSH